MKKATDYRQHATECRTLAQQMKPGEQREQLLEIARTWDKLAEERERADRYTRATCHAYNTTVTLALEPDERWSLASDHHAPLSHSGCSVPRQCPRGS